ALPAQLLDFVRAGREQHQGAGRLYRAAQDPVGDRLPASRRLLPRRAENDAGPARRRVAGDEASGHGRGPEGLLWPCLSARTHLGAGILPTRATPPRSPALGLPPPLPP